MYQATDGDFVYNTVTGDFINPQNPDYLAWLAAGNTLTPLPASYRIAKKKAAISGAAEMEISAIKSGYPESEVLSWSKQETEARAYLANNAAAVPLLDAMSGARAMSKAELAARIVAKSDAFAVLSGAVIGKRQKLEDQIDALGNNATQQQLDAIQWS